MILLDFEMDEHHLGDIINFLDSNKQAINTEWGYEYVKNRCKGIIAKGDDFHKMNLQMMPYKDLLITEKDNRNKAYSCCMECSLGFIDYSNQPDDNYNYVFVYQDDVTKFTILKPLKEKVRDEISHCLLEIFSLIGVPSKIWTCEKSLVKSVFNKDIGSFCQNFVTKIKEPKNGTFEETECCRIDKNIKEWMKSAMSTKWSQGLYFVQFRHNCYFNKAINAAPFYALLKPSYTYSRRKYTRYLYQTKDQEETTRPFYVRNRVCRSNRAIEGTSQLERYCKEKIEETCSLALREREDVPSHCNNTRLVCVKAFDSEYQLNMRGKDCDIANSEFGRPIEKVYQGCCIEDHEGECDNNSVNVINKYNMEQPIFGLSKNECDQIQKRKQIFDLSRSLSEDLCKELRQINLLPQIPKCNMSENNNIEKVESENCFTNESNQQSYIIGSLSNHCGSVNLCEEPTECYKKRKNDTGNERLTVPENASFHVLRLVNDHNINKATLKLKQDKNIQGRKYLNKRTVKDHDYVHPANIGNRIPLRNKCCKDHLQLTDVSSNNLGDVKNADNNQCTSNENRSTLHKRYVRPNAERPHDCRGKQVCSTCNKKIKQNTVLNTLNKVRLTIGSTVRVRVPVAERKRGYPNFISATIIEEKDNMYKVSTSKGVLKEKFKRDQLFPCNAPALDTGSLAAAKAPETGAAPKSKIKRPFK